MSLFVLSSKDGWVNIMYDGLDAVGIDQQVRWFESVMFKNITPLPVESPISHTGYCCLCVSSWNVDAAC